MVDGFVKFDITTAARGASIPRGRFVYDEWVDRNGGGVGKAPNCLQCKHFIVTWNPRYPRGCAVFGIKSVRLPSLVVFENTSRHCPSFEPTQAHRSR